MRVTPHTPAMRAQVSARDVGAAVARLRRQSENPVRDVALFYILLATGAKPHQIASMRVRDYVGETADCDTDAAVGKLLRDSLTARAALDRYLEERGRRRLGVGADDRFRGLDPDSALFLTEAGRPFTRRARSKRDGRLTTPVLVATYRAIFRRAGWDGVTAQTVRRLVAQRLSESGAGEQELCEQLGITSRRSIARLVARAKASPFEIRGSI